MTPDMILAALLAAVITTAILDIALDDPDATTAGLVICIFLLIAFAVVK